MNLAGSKSRRMRYRWRADRGEFHNTTPNALKQRTTRRIGQVNVPNRNDLPRASPLAAIFLDLVSLGVQPFLNLFAKGAVSLGDGKGCGIRKDRHPMQSHLFYLDREGNDRF